MYCIKTGCKERQKYIHIFQNSLKYSSASLSVSWKRLYNFSNCAVAIQWLACMQFIAMQANDWISNPLPNEQNADAQQTQKRVSAGFANVGVRLDAPRSVQPHSWNPFKFHIPDMPRVTVIWNLPFFYIITLRIYPQCLFSALPSLVLVNLRPFLLDRTCPPH